MAVNKHEVHVTSQKDVQLLVKLLGKWLPFADVDATHGRYRISARSILGWFSLDLSQPITLELLSNDKSDIELFVKVINEYEKETRNE